MTGKLLRVLLRYAVIALAVVGGVALIRDTAYNGHDFVVFWKAASSNLAGQPVYSTARDGSMSFKYPPWTVPAFFPLSLIPLELAKWIWGAFEVAALIAVALWVSTKARCRVPVVISVALSFWGIWAVHALDGQVILIVLAIALWAWSPQVFERFGPRSFLLVWALTTKIFTLFPLLGVSVSRRSIRTFAGIGGTFLLLSIPACWVSQNHSPMGLLQSWHETAASSGVLMKDKDTRGKSNPSLTELSLRVLGIKQENTAGDLTAFLFFAIVLGFAWSRLSKGLGYHEAWAGWLALTPVVHPLPWWHLFVFSFPLAAIALDRATRTKKATLEVLAVFGIALICVSTEKALGPLGAFLEVIAAKSWGVLICAVALVYSRRALPREPKLKS